MLRDELIWIGGLAALLAACTPSLTVGDRYYQEARYPQAAAAYEEALHMGPMDVESEMLMLYRLGLIYAVPGTTVYDPDKAVEVLGALIRLGPDAPNHLEAILLRDLLREAKRLSGRLATRQELVESLSIERSRLQSVLERTEGEAGESEDRVLEMSGRIDRLRREINFLQDEVDRRRQELERLKEIDLGGPS